MCRLTLVARPNKIQWPQTKLSWPGCNYPQDSDTTRAASRVWKKRRAPVFVIGLMMTLITSLKPFILQE